jgi:hypothetical protein
MERGRGARADALVRAILSVQGGGLRAAYVASVARAEPTARFASTLDALCERAEQAEALAREALIAVVDALNAEGMTRVVQSLREQTAAEPLLALERLIRAPVPPRGRDSDAPSRISPPPGQHLGVLARDGRPLTLGERKSLARRPDRETLQRLFADPHPDVMRRLLRNPRLTEDDVVRLAARRPGRGELLAEIAREPHWVHRPRVRMALVMNPATPPEMAARIAGLLLRPELELVFRSPGVPAAVRALCIEHLERRPPFAGRDGAALRGKA